jgi:YidC/Oxa1 family membrane protein insertase
MLPDHFQKALTYGFPALTLVFMQGWPAALQISFAVTSLLSVLQSTILRNPVFRNWYGIPPPPRKLTESTSSSPVYTGNLRLGKSARGVVEPPATTPPQPTPGLGGIMDKAKSNLREIRDEMAKTVDKYGGEKGTKSRDQKAAAAYEKRRSAEEAARLEKEVQEKKKRWLARKQQRSQ